MAELRSFIFLDQLQPQTMCYLGTWVRGRLPRLGVAAQVIEIAPGLDIEPLTDVALKEADVQAGILVVERQFGYLELHGGTAAVQRGGQRGARPRSGVSATSATSRRCWPRGSSPASMPSTRSWSTGTSSARWCCPGVAVRARAPAGLVRDPGRQRGGEGGPIKIVDYRMIGATGRVYLSGREDDVRQAAEAVTALLGEPR